MPLLLKISHDVTSSVHVLIAYSMTSRSGPPGSSPFIALVQVPGVIVMEVVSNQNFTTDLQWQRIVIAFNASSKEYTGVRSQRDKAMLCL